jgi:hypothetical protein
MSKQSHQSSISAPTYKGRRLVVRGEAYPEPKWDLYIAALLAYSLRAVQEPEGKEAGDD